MLKLVAVLLVLAASVNALYVENHLQEYHDGIHVLADFCFASKHTAEAKLEFMFMYPKIYRAERLWLIPDEYNIEDDSCVGIMIALPTDYMIDLLPGVYDAGCESVYVDGVEHYNCTNSIIMGGDSPRHWRIAIAKCEVSYDEMFGMRLTHYWLRLTNGNSGDEDPGCSSG